MENHLGQKGIRLDIYIEDKGAQRVIDMEMSDGTKFVQRLRLALI